jgi:hypothetical protein
MTDYVVEIYLCQKGQLKSDCLTAYTDLTQAPDDNTEKSNSKKMARNDENLPSTHFTYL